VNVSILFNIIDRFELARECLLPAIRHCGYDDYEVLACNNGSRQKGIDAFFLDVPRLSYRRDNKENEGNYQMINQLMLRAKGPFYCIMDPDIQLPKNWLEKLVSTYYALLREEVIRPGIAGLHCVRDHNGPHTYGTQTVLVKKNGIFGTKFFGQYVVDKIGYFIEISKYGFGDTNYGRRANRAGMVNFYLHGMEAVHCGTEEDTAHRAFKNEEMKKVGAGRRRLWKAYGREYIYVPPPTER
jgi:GT2 family glycosyltransferase